MIRSGELASGDRLPSVRQLAADLRIAPGTVARAFKSLDAEGLTESSRSVGTRVRPGNDVDEPLNSAATRLVESISEGSAQLDDVLAAVTAAWNRRQNTAR